MDIETQVCNRINGCMKKSAQHREDVRARVREVMLQNPRIGLRKLCQIVRGTEGTVGTAYRKFKQGRYESLPVLPVHVQRVRYREAGVPAGRAAVPVCADYEKDSECDVRGKMTADDIINAWIADDSCEMDLCKYCIHDAEHLVGAACTGFVWNGKELDERFRV